MEYRERFCPACNRYRPNTMQFYTVKDKFGKFKYYRCEVCNDLRKRIMKGEIRPCA